MSQITTAIPMMITMINTQITGLIPLDVFSTLSLDASWSALSVGAAVPVSAAISVGSGAGVLVSVGSGVGVLVSVGSGVGVLVSVGSGVGVLVSVGSGVGVLVSVGSGVGVVVLVGSGVGVLVLVGFGVGVLVGSAFFASAFSSSLCAEAFPASAFSSSLPSVTLSPADCASASVSGISSTEFSSVLVAWAISTQPETPPASVLPQIPSLPVSTSVSM